MDTSTPGKAMAARHRLELEYLQRLRGMMRSRDVAAQPWHTLGILTVEAEAAKLHHANYKDAAQQFYGRLRAKATYDFNRVQFDAIPEGFNKRWVAHHDERTRAEHRLLDGQTVKKYQPFTVGADHLQMPGDPAAPASLSFNCRCILVPVEPK